MSGRSGHRRVLEGSIPCFGSRRFELHTERTILNPGSNRRGSNETMAFSEIGQVGTQCDGFSHQTIGNSIYNCFTMLDTSTRTGFTKLGIERVGTLMTRGVLINVAASRGVETLPDAAWGEQGRRFAQTLAQRAGR